MSPINHCRSLGYEGQDIIIDVILSGNPHMHHVYAKIFNAFAVAQRTFEVMTYYTRMFGILRAKNGHPDVQFRYVVGPLREMPTKIVPIDYSPEEVKKQIEIGERDAKIFVEKEKERIEFDRKRPKVMASHEDDGIGEKPDYYRCDVKKRYYNKKRQAKHVKWCGKNRK